MAFDISKIQDSLNKYVVSPASVFGLAGFVFDIVGDVSTTMTADITDHYVEDNSTIQDHVAIKPFTVTLKGYVGELVYTEESKAEDILSGAVQKLTVLNAYLPKLAKGAQTIKNAYDNAGSFSFDAITDDTLNTFRDIYALVKNLNPANGKEKQAYMYFKSLMESKTIMSYQTPFEFMTDLVIENVTATENETNKYITDFSITLKQVRFAQTKVTKFDSAKYGANRTSSQAAPEYNMGVVQGKVDPSTSQTVSTSSMTDKDLFSGKETIEQAVSKTKAGRSAMSGSGADDAALDNLFIRKMPK